MRTLADNKKKKEVYEVSYLIENIDKNSTDADPLIYNTEKMAVFGANIILRRHINEIKDGLKPINRRILLTMYENRLYNGKFSKSTQITGDVTNKYHPHSPDAAYEALVFMGQPWRNNMTLVYSTSNFGSAYNPNGYAADRYTEASLSDFAYDCYFKDWELPQRHSDDMSVDWIPTYDDRDVEPMYLPSRYPLFLLQWHSAIAIGRYTCTPGFNLREAFDLVIKLIEDKNAKATIYPEDPKGCTIINKYDLSNMLDETNIKVKIRSTYTIENENGHDRITISNIPFETTPTTVHDAIRELSLTGELPELLNLGINSEEMGDTFDLMLDVKKGYDPNALMMKLFRKTQLSKTFSIKYGFVNGLQSVDYTLRIGILEWIRCRRDTIKRMHKIRLINIIKRLMFLNPMIKVLKSGEIDEFIRIVRTNKKDDAIKKIMDKFSLTDYQAEKIVGVRIDSLSTDEYDKLKDEREKLIIEQSRLEEIVKSSKAIEQIIIDQLTDGIKKYGKPRRTKVTQLIDSVHIADTIHYLIFTKKYIKKIPYDDKGYKIGKVDSDDKVVKIMVVNNRDKIAIFTKDGKCLPIDVNDISNTGTQSSGISYTQLGAKDNRFANAIIMNIDNANKHIISVTEKGYISKRLYEDIADKMKLFAFMKIDPEDSMSNITITNESDDLIVFTDKGNASMFTSSGFEATSLNTKGVIAAKLEDKEIVIGVSSFSTGTKELFVLTDRAYAKKFPISSLPVTKRNGKCIDVNSGNGTVIEIKAIPNIDNTLLYIGTTIGSFAVDPADMKAKARIGKNERMVELSQNEYAFGLI